jgi:Protein of unknown function (DUF1367)
MALDLILARGACHYDACLVGSDQIARESLEKIWESELVHAKLSRPRNPAHHRKAFALLSEVFKSQTVYATLENMLDDIKISIGHCRVFAGADGTVRTVPLSVSFAAMDQTSFEQFYDRMVDFILAKILPHTKRADLEERIFEILGEFGPSAIR